MEDAQNSIASDNEKLPARRQGQRLAPDELATAKAVFLATFAQSANVTQSARVAGVARGTIYVWREFDEVFSAAFSEAELEANDRLLEAAWERAVTGISRPLVSMGRMVHEEFPILNEDGSPVLDAHGKPRMRLGKPLEVKEYSDQLLTLLLRARMPDQFREKQQVDLGVNGNLNMTHQGAHMLQIDVRNMTADELATVRTIAEAMKAREGG